MAPRTQQGTALLPGVRRDEERHRSDSRGAAVVAAARRDANRADLFDLLALVAVDAVFFNWRATHIPLLDREMSMYVLLILHLVVCTHIVLRRKLPEWRAKRIAATWGRKEQEQLRRKRE